MVSEKIKNKAAEHGLTDDTTTSIIMDWLDNMDLYQQERVLAYFTRRAEYEGKCCARCGSELVEGICQEDDCPFQFRSQDDPKGWIGHPDPPRRS